MISELRKDLVSGDWVTIATGRINRPKSLFLKQKKEISDIKRCPFENPQKSGNYPPILTFYKNALEKPNDWLIQVIPNKYPAFGVGTCSDEKQEGPYKRLEGYGFHEVIIYRHHTKDPSKFDQKTTSYMFLAFIKRYQALKNQNCLKYISIFHNHRKEAGASIAHPHSQLIAIPVIPPDIYRSLQGSTDYYRANKKCVHCVMINWELKEKKRLIFENKNYICFAPYASKTSFEMRIFPKKHESHFEETSRENLDDLTQIFNTSLKKLSNFLKNPPYNFFIHTAPIINKHLYNHYHWHIEILPKTAIWAGFEISTGIEISTVLPEQAAKYLKAIKP